MENKTQIEAQRQTAKILLRLALGVKARTHAKFTDTIEGVRVTARRLECYDKNCDQLFFLTEGTVTHELSKYLAENNGYFWIGLEGDGDTIYCEIVFKGGEEE